jgi:signal transduction histidine kinase
MSADSVKVLLIEDNPGDAHLIQTVLGSAEMMGSSIHMFSAFDVEHVDRLSTGLERLRAGGIGLVLLDLSLPDSRGFDTFARVHAQASHVPIVVLTGLADAELAAEVVRKGAQDYLVKGEIEGNLLVRTMRYAIERRRAEEALRDGERRMHRQERLAAVGQLAGGIAHDFNNFLTTIMLYANLILRSKDIPSNLRPVAQTILSESRRAARLVAQVLDFSRRSVMDIQPVDLGSFIGEAVDILRKTLPENIRLLVELGQGEYVVNADPTRIQQVVMNLALNARDAMPEGGELRISLSGAEKGLGESGPTVVEVPAAEMPAAGVPGGEWVCLNISDTGTGMTEEVQSHLFEPFFTTKGPKGTGLGLAQVYGIVKQHGGHIGFKTALGQGTTFWICLPACKVEEAASDTTKPSAVPEGRGEIILLVEDEEKVREAGRRILESMGYQVLTATDGQEGLEVYLAAERVDLVLADMVMPGTGGKTLVRELRKVNPDVKTVVMTGYVMRDDLHELKEEGVMEVVHKPLDIGVLGEAIRRVLDAS